MAARKSRANKNLKRRRAPVKTKPKLPDAVLDQLNTQRERIHQAMGIVSCARYASDSMIVPQRGEPNLVDGLAAALDILGPAAEALEDLLPNDYFDKGGAE